MVIRSDHLKLQEKFSATLTPQKVMIWASQESFKK